MEPSALTVAIKSRKQKKQENADVIERHADVNYGAARPLLGEQKTS